MNLRHFATFAPACVVCLQTGAGVHRLRIDQGVSGTDEYLEEGILRCSNPACCREVPVLNGLPLLVSSLRTFVNEQLFSLLGREDTSPLMESLLGDACGPGSTFDALRQRLSTYGWGHYGDLVSAKGGREPASTGSVVELLTRGLSLLASHGGLPEGPVLDVGCGPGRSTFELAERLKRPTVGVDLDPGLLRLARRVLRHPQSAFPLRQGGLVYESVHFPVSFAERSRVDFWCADASTLPFGGAWVGESTVGESPVGGSSFALATSFNLLDCLPNPRAHLVELGRILKPGGYALIACPYDWSPHTPQDAWLGGHSQRGAERGSSEAVLRLLLTPGAHPSSLRSLALVDELEGLPWQVRMHARSRITYEVHLVLARATGLPDSGAV